MKNLFSLILFVAFFSCIISVASNSNINAANKGGAVAVKTFTPAQTQAVIQSITDINGMVSTEIHLDTSQAGVCDTCKSEFKAVLSDNRRLVDSLNVENSILYENWQKTIALNDTLERIQNLVRLQVLRAKVVLVKR
jgi:hypothetical protein